MIFFSPRKKVKKKIKMIEMAIGYQYISATAPRKKMAKKIIRIRGELIASFILLLKFRFNSAYVFH